MSISVKGCACRPPWHRPLERQNGNWGAGGQTGFHQPNKWKASSATLRGESCRCSWHPRIPSGVVFGGLRDWAGVLFSAVSYDIVTEEEQPSPDMKWQRRRDARVKNRPLQWRRQTSALRLANDEDNPWREFFVQGKVTLKAVVFTLSVTPLNATQAQVFDLVFQAVIWCFSSFIKDSPKGNREMDHMSPIFQCCWENTKSKT